MSRLSSFHLPTIGAADNHDLPRLVFDRLEQAVAVVNLDYTICLSNPTFDHTFRNSVDLELILTFIRQMETADNAKHELLCFNSRLLSVQSAALPFGYIITISDVSTQSADKKQLVDQARTDTLTSLGNRLMLQERLAQLLSKVSGGTVHAVLAINLDRFKVVNDTLGHHVGDALLCMVAERIQSAIGPQDLIGRLGGDEFCVVQIGQTQPHAAAVLAKRLVDLIGRSYLLDGNLINIGVSVGLALGPANVKNGNSLLKNADLALHRAKQSGRGRFCFFEKEMDDEMQARRKFEIDLRRALALREFGLVYQPQYNLHSKAITGFEALLRWNRDGMGHVSPADFIPLAEETGLIVPIGEWVLRTACKEAASWNEQLDVAVNVSATQFATPGLASTVMSALAESGLDPRRLELEITESVLIVDHEIALDVLRTVQNLGVRISMDDFGTGYSSLSYLRSFPFNKIKIDQSFVRGNPEDPSGMAIVRAIAALGKSLGMSTTAEGVETEEQMARIMADGCTDVQGYFISRPLPRDGIAGFLKQHSFRHQ